jgi:RecA-family ATPase
MTDTLDEALARLQTVAVTNGKIAETVSATDEVQLLYKLMLSRMLTADQLESLPPPVPLIEGYCSQDTLLTTVGRPGTAKTLIAMSQCFCIVTGQPWFGHQVRQGPALYIVGEGTAGLAQRQRAWREACNWSALEGMHWLPMAVNLLDATRAQALVRVVEKVQPVYTVIDTVARSMPGGDENGSADMGKLVMAADQIREAACCTVNLVHHTPREGSTPRGHSALEGAVDTVLLL